MASATCENSYISSGGPDADMGESHEEAHKDQHDFMQEGEKPIETLTPNKPSDSSKDLAQAKAEEQGLLSPEEWPAANAKKKKRDRKGSYREYVEAKSRNLVKNKKNQMHNADTPRKTREKIAQELASIKRNHGMPIDGCLFYLTNTDVYTQQSPEQLKVYRAFEAKTFRDFYHSKLFQALNTGVFRAEIHYDERGTMHLQTQAVWYRKDSLGRVSYAKRATVKENMMKFFNWNETDFDRELQMLCAVHSRTGKPQEGAQKYTAHFNDMYKVHFSKTSDKDFQDELDEVSGVKGETTEDGKPKHFKAGGSAKRGRIYELWRLAMMHELASIAEKNASKFTVKNKKNGKTEHVIWKQGDTYMTDGNHRTGPEYVRDQKLAKLHEQVSDAQQQLDDTNDKLTDAKKDLDITNTSLTDTKTALKSEQAEFKSVHAKLTSDKAEQTSVSQELAKLQKQRDAARAKKEDVERRLSQIRQQVQQEEQRRRQRKRELDNREKALNERESAVKKSSDQLDTRTQDVEKQEQSINDKLQELERRETAVAKRESSVQQQEGFFKHFAKALVFWMKTILSGDFDELHKTITAEVTADLQGKKEEALRLQQQEQQQREALREKALKTKNVFAATTRARFADIDKTSKNDQQQAFSDRMHDKITDIANGEDVNGNPINGDTPIDKAAEEHKKAQKKPDDGNDLEL